MKLFSVIIILTLLALSCNTQKVATTTPSSQISMPNTTNSTPIPTTARSLVYEATTRGYFLKVTYNNHTLQIFKERDQLQNGTTIALSKSDIQKLNTLLQKINLSQIATLTGSTQKRFYDGAAHANIEISENDKIYTTQGFDHGFPPMPIQELVNQLLFFAEKK